jgi:hypothetical protein
LSDTHFQRAIRCLWNNLKPGGKIYASMSGWTQYYRDKATQAEDGLWNVKFKTDRLDYDLFVNFTRDKDHLRQKFSLFKPIYLDYYDSSFREEGSGFRYTFFGIKEDIRATGGDKAEIYRNHYERVLQARQAKAHGDLRE